MATITKKELIDRIAEKTDQKRVQVKKVVQMFLEEIISELGRGNRLEFRDFGVFETKTRKARRAQNPRTLEPVKVPEKRTVKFKIGRLMKAKLDVEDSPEDENGDDLEEVKRRSPDRPGRDLDEHGVPSSMEGSAVQAGEGGQV